LSIRKTNILSKNKQNSQQSAKQGHQKVSVVHINQKIYLAVCWGKTKQNWTLLRGCLCSMQQKSCPIDWWNFQMGLLDSVGLFPDGQMKFSGKIVREFLKLSVL